MSQLEPAAETGVAEPIRLARATVANTFVMTANFYLAATTITAIGEVVIVCLGTLFALAMASDPVWTAYSVGLAFLVSNHLVAVFASMGLRALAFVVRRSGGPAAIVGGLIAAVLPGVEVLLALPTSMCAAGVQIALWFAVWGIGIAAAYRAAKLVKLEREQLYDTLG
ncbi:MAG: hypothetical protein KC912_04250 [Proteobacteria bacterium]|nr:hypothetical protein [Pseudomonadota bacterium]